MSVAQTEAAKKLEAYGTEVNSHKVISLLMEEALERISQAQVAIKLDNIDDAQILVDKLTAIINGLHNSLNFEAGGAVALNLDKVYSYILDRLEALPLEESLEALDEMARLINEIKSGWDAIEPRSQEKIARAS
jgi:flagellar protein FliS